MSPKAPWHRYVRANDRLSRQSVLNQTDASGETVEDHGQASVVRDDVTVGVDGEGPSLGHLSGIPNAIKGLT
jgi:hypothetical protein